jgi:FTR1 family protein
LGFIWDLFMQNSVRHRCLLAFISVLREGIETVLFIVGSAQEVSVLATIGGSILGFGVAAILGYITLSRSTSSSTQILFQYNECTFYCHGSRSFGRRNS